MDIMGCTTNLSAPKYLTTKYVSTGGINMAKHSRHERRGGRGYNPFTLDMGMGPKNPRPPYGMDYAMRGIRDTSLIATYGLVTAGTIGVVGSLLKK